MFSIFNPLNVQFATFCLGNLLLTSIYTCCASFISLMHTWLAHLGRIAYLTCSLLEPWSHSFFTSSFGLAPFRIDKVLRHDAEVYQVKQIHGNVLTLQKSDAQPVV